VTYRVELSGYRLQFGKTKAFDAQARRWKRRDSMTDGLTEITVIGDDDTGLIAGVTNLLFERGINIEDLDQAVREGVFRMKTRVDTSEMVCTRDKLRDDLEELGDELGVEVRIRFPDDREARQIAVLVSKESHPLRAILEDWGGNGDAEVSVVIGNHSDLKPIADEHGVPFHGIGDEKGAPDEGRLLELLNEYGIDLVVLARYMRILSPEVVFRYENRIINIHPSLLPSFPGAEAYLQAVEEGVRIAGVTAHYVTTDLDQGPIITQNAFNVPPDADADELRRIGQPVEAETLLRAINLHLSDDVAVHRGRTRLRNPDDRDDVRLGAPEELDAALPDEPVDEPVERVAGDTEEDAEAGAVSED
jgi:formyltetrahydrofolate deformylase